MRRPCSFENDLHDSRIYVPSGLRASNRFKVGACDIEGGLRNLRVSVIHVLIPIKHGTAGAIFRAAQIAAKGSTEPCPPFSTLRTPNFRRRSKRFSRLSFLRLDVATKRPRLTSQAIGAKCSIADRYEKQLRESHVPSNGTVRGQGNCSDSGRVPRLFFAPRSNQIDPEDQRG